MTDFKSLYKKLCSQYHVERENFVLDSLSNDGKLDLSGRTISPETGAILGKIFELSKEISKVILENCLLSEEALKSLLIGLCGNFSVVLLSLKGNAIQGSSALELARLFEKNNKLKSVSLEWNNLGLCSDTFSKILEALHHNHSLTHLDLRSNQLGLQSAKTISQLLLKNSTLSSLDLRFNNLCNEGGRVILEGVRHNYTLTSVLVQGNNISLEIMAELTMHLSNNMKISAMRDEYEKELNFLRQRLRIQEETAVRQIDAIEKNYVNNSSSLTNALRDSQDKISSLQSEIGTKTDQLQVLTLKCDTMSNELEKKDRILNHLKKDKIHLEKEVEKNIHIREQMMKELSELKDDQIRFENNQAVMWEQKEKIIALEAELKNTKVEAEANIEMEKAKHKDQLRKQEKNFLAQISKLNKEIKEKEEELKKGKKGWDSAKDDFEEELRILKQNLASEKEMKQFEMSSLRQQLKHENKAEVRLLENQLREVTQNREEVESKLRSQTSTCGFLTATNTRLESQIHSLNSEVVTLKAEVEGKEESIRAAEQRVRNELRRQLQDLEDLKEQNIRIRASLEDSKREKALEKQEFEKRLSETKSEMERLKTSLLERDKELIRMREDESRRVGLLHSAFMEYLPRPTSSCTK